MKNQLKLNDVVYRLNHNNVLNRYVVIRELQNKVIAIDENKRKIEFEKQFNHHIYPINGGGYFDVYKLETEIIKLAYKKQRFITVGYDENPTIIDNGNIHPRSIELTVNKEYYPKYESTGEYTGEWPIHPVTGAKLPISELIPIDDSTAFNLLEVVAVAVLFFVCVLYNI